MSETFEEKINRILRDHEGYDGNGGEGALPIGDRSTAQRPIIKRDLREALRAFADVEGNAGDALTARSEAVAAARDAGEKAIQTAQDRAYVEDRAGALEGISVSGVVRKESVACATTGDIALTGEKTLDGVTTSESRVLVKNQTAPAENGIYITASGAWSRAADLDAAGEVQGAAVYVMEGAVAGGATYYTGSAVATLGVDPVVWAVVEDHSAFAVQLQNTQASVGELEKTLGEASGMNGLVLRNEAGDVGVVLNEDQLLTSGYEVGRDGFTGQDLAVTHRDIPGVSIISCDAVGNVDWWIGTDGVFHGRQEENPTAVSDGYSARDARNLALSAADAEQASVKMQRLGDGYNVIITYGQSLSTGQESWPALAVAPVSGCYMLGNASRPAWGSSSDFEPIGDDVFRPLVSTVVANGVVLTPAQQAALPAGDPALGESPDVGAVNTFRQFWLDHFSTASDGRELVSINCGVGGRTVAQLSKGASPEYYGRVTDALTKAKALADAEGVPIRVVAVMYLQGEADYGGATPAATYKSGMVQLRADLDADIAAITGQDRQAAFVTYQTGANYAKDGLSIGQAQLELSEEQQNWFLAAPAYPVTDKGGHLHPNGSRWLGVQFGKVLNAIFSRGNAWRPLSPRQATVAGKTVVIDFYVPKPPLVFGQPYAGTTAVDYLNEGFRVFDDGTECLITSVEILNATQVKLMLNSEPSGLVSIRYGDRSTSGGSGCLRDSDATVSPYDYTYDAGSGQYAATNIPALVDKPYPLWNWATSFNINAMET